METKYGNMICVQILQSEGKRGRKAEGTRGRGRGEEEKRKMGRGRGEEEEGKRKRGRGEAGLSKPGVSNENNAITRTTAKAWS